MKRDFFFIFLLSVFSIFFVFGNSRSCLNVSYDEYLIDRTIDLHKDTLWIPTNRLVKFAPNGIIRNGVVIFQEGEYHVEATKEQPRCIIIGDNTEVIINGKITLLPNELNSYCILLLKGKDIVVKGSGVIYGDKAEHFGKEGEWGHGLQIYGCGKILIDGVSIKNCWGDCIYVRNKNVDATIKGCILDHGRRQGISITAASTVMIENTVIENVRGKSPQYAIDVEPNANDTIDKVLIKNVRIKDCKGGIVASSRAKNSYVGSVEVEDCVVDGHMYYPYYFCTLPRVSVRNCKAGEGRKNITYHDVKRFIQKNNKVVGFKKPVTQEK